MCGLKIIGIAFGGVFIIFFLVIVATNLSEDTNQFEKPPAGYAYFTNGTHTIGQDVLAGTYRTRRSAPGCYYARLANFSGSLNDIIANENTNAPAIVTISPDDRGFISRRCGIWSQDLSTINASVTNFGDGIYIVGSDIEPGTYRTNGGRGCYFARLSGFGGTLGEIIANENTDAPAIVTISPSDRGFKSVRCGVWTKFE
jgi:hypothetical protein